MLYDYLPNSLSEACGDSRSMEAMKGGDWTVPTRTISSPNLKAITSILAKILANSVESKL